MQKSIPLRTAGVLMSAGLLAGTPVSRAVQPSPTVSPVVVELFTSQGCSSCPAADALLGELTTRPNVIALAFHVGYWDSIGWRDIFAVPESTSRQSRYVKTLGLSNAFTPQAVIDGRRSVVGSDRSRLLAALAASAESISFTADVVDGDVVVTLPEHQPTDAYELNAVALLSQATTAIGHGENGGRTLKEYNIVRQFRRLGEWHGVQKTFKVPLASFPRDATHVAVLLQRSGQGSIDGSVIAALQ